MVQTRSQLEHPSKDKLVEELMSIEDMSSKMASLRTWSDDFVRRFEIWDLSTESAVFKYSSCILSERIIQLE